MTTKHNYNATTRQIIADSIAGVISVWLTIL
jgi:hypothetical protein